MKTNIVLIGFMGAGKSLVANILSHKYKMRCLSTDETVEKKAGRKVSEIFQKDGEARFRQMEKAAVKEISESQNVIVDCGGGIVLDPDNVKALKKKGILFYLQASPEVVLKRLKDHKNRPLLQVDNPLERIKELMKERKKLYEQADFTIFTDQQTIEQTALAVVALWKPKAANQKSDSSTK